MSDNVNPLPTDAATTWLRCAAHVPERLRQSTAAAVLPSEKR